MKYVLLKEIRKNLSKISDNNYLVLKSDAYGFGLKQILKEIKKTSLYKFCVINIDDAICIRKKIINAKILLITPFNEEYIHLYKKYKIELSINKISDVNVVLKYNLKYQIAINSGMNRFGLKEINEDMITENLTGIYSHNATDDLNHIQNQIVYFNEIIKPKNIDIHFFASSHINLLYGNCRRIGESIYTNSLLIKSSIIHYVYIKKGEYVGYDYTYKASNNMLIGVLDIGYADGLVRNCNNFKVYSNGKYYSLIGKSCMNHCFVKIDSEKIKEVEIISENNPIENYSSHFNITKHEIFISYSLSTNNYIN